MHNSADNHADNPHERCQDANENKVFRIQLLFHFYASSLLSENKKCDVVI